MICPKCGEILDAGARQCTRCGQALSSAGAGAGPVGQAPNPFADDPVVEAMMVYPPPYSRPEGNAALRMLAPIGQSPLALISGYLGLISLAMCFLGPVAVILGILGIRQIRNNAHMHGTYRAVIGIVLGTIGTFGLIALIFTLAATE
jgi:hypothetical protein